jgi:hypothetical protein
MRKNILIIIMLAGALGFVAACTKSSFDDKYTDPEKATTATIDALFTGMFRNRCIIPDYWNLWTFVSSQMAVYTQTIGVVNNNKMYQQSTNYTQDRWNSFYTSPGTDWTAPISSFREMEKLYNNLSSEADRAGYLLFMEASRVFLYDQATQLVDMWGDIPFSAAGKLNTTGQIALASYDGAAAIYDSAFANLKRINAWMADAQTESFYKNKFAKADYLLKGDLTWWRRYCNSLMLRLAMRISYKDEAKAKAMVQEMLANPSQYPLIEEITQNVQVVTGASTLTTNLRDAFNANHDVAPGYMVDSLMEPTGDPRLRLIFTKNKSGEYQGLPPLANGAVQSAAINSGQISRLDSTTFVNNTAFPGIIFTAAEVSFLKAEAYERWGGGSAKTAYETGIRQSIAYYNQLHRLNSAGPYETAPTEAEITVMLLNPLVAYGLLGREDNLNKIGLQKWSNFGVMQNVQAWADMRRSGYPRLKFYNDATTPGAVTPANRLLYPDNERTLNAENYSKVSANDGMYNKIFWQVR